MVELARDAVTLAELQSRLFKVEMQQSLRALVLPLILWGAALGIALSAVYVLLVSLAYTMVEFAEWSRALSFLFSGVVGGGVAGAIAWAGWARLRATWSVWERSREELHRNVEWIKQALQQRTPSTGGATRPRQWSDTQQG